jgi:hypothetical protein
MAIVAARGTDEFVLDPNDPFEALLIEMVQLNRAKRHDYAGDSDPWQNFYDSAQQVNGTAGQSVETLIATKQARLRQLLFTGRSPKNESVRDTILDRAVYSVIALSIFDRGDYSPETSGGKHATSVSLTTVRHTNMEKGIIV